MTHYVRDVYVITSLLHIITVVIFACYCMLIQNLLLHCYYILLHCYYLLLHQSLLPVITNSLLLIITSLLRHYYVIFTSLCNLQNSCNNGFIITYYYLGLFHYYIIITHHVIISHWHYYLLLTGQLADGAPRDSSPSQLTSRIPLWPAQSLQAWPAGRITDSYLEPVTWVGSSRQPAANLSFWLGRG